MENRKQPFDLLPTIESRIIAGVLSFTGIIILIFWVAINEPARMEEFTQRSDGRSIETGATLFESNCSSCHGPEGYGLTGVAPALNNPQLFGYEFFAELDAEIVVLEEELEATTDEARIAEIEAELEVLALERAALYDDLLYNYGDHLAELETELADLTAQAEELGFDALGLTLEITRLNDEIATIETELEGVLAEIETAQANGDDPGEELVTRRDELQGQLDALNTQLAPLRTLDSALTSVSTATNSFRELMTPHNAIVEARTELIQVRRDMMADDADTDALTARAEELENTIDGQLNAREAAYEKLVANGSIIDFDPEAPSRMETLRWSGGLHDLVYTTILGGRPTSASYWNNPMAAWGQSAGGPLRNDEIESLADFIMNWNREFTREDIRNIRQYAIIPSKGGAPAVDADSAVGTDVDEIVAQLESVEGDSTAGQQSFTALGCAGCHMVGGGGAGPDPTGVAVRAQEYADAGDYDSARHYLVSSIVNPNAFLAPGYLGNLMPPQFGTTLSIDDMANLIAYLESFDVQ